MSSSGHWPVAIALKYKCAQNKLYLLRLQYILRLVAVTKSLMRLINMLNHWLSFTHACGNILLCKEYVIHVMPMIPHKGMKTLRVVKSIASLLEFFYDPKKGGRGRMERVTNMERIRFWGGTQMADLHTKNTGSICS